MADANNPKCKSEVQGRKIHIFHFDVKEIIFNLGIYLLIGSLIIGDKRENKLIIVKIKNKIWWQKLKKDSHYKYCNVVIDPDHSLSGTG